jgi:hypothetical protein
MAKDAWGHDDRPAVERHYRLALEAMDRAHALDPRDEDARSMAALRRKRLTDLLAGSSPK